MQGLLLLALLSLGVPMGVSTRTEGELCRAWSYGVDPLVGPFQCPEGLDATDAKFCCGTCSAPYCCSSGAARLDQTQCVLPAPLKAEAVPGLTDPEPTSHATEDDVWMVTWFWVAMFFLFLFVCLCFCYYMEIFTWLKSKLWWRAQQLAADPRELDDLCSDTKLRTQTKDVAPAPSNDSHVQPAPSPSYGSLEMGDSQSIQVHSSSGEDAEDEVTIPPYIASRL